MPLLNNVKPVIAEGGVVLAMASKRASIAVPTRVYAGLELSRLEEIADDDAKFFEYFVTLELKEVS